MLRYFAIWSHLFQFFLSLSFLIQWKSCGSNLLRIVLEYQIFQKMNWFSEKENFSRFRLVREKILAMGWKSWTSFPWVSFFLKRGERGRISRLRNGKLQSYLVDIYLDRWKKVKSIYPSPQSILPPQFSIVNIPSRYFHFIIRNNSIHVLLTDWNTDANFHFRANTMFTRAIFSQLNYHQLIYHAW